MPKKIFFRTRIYFTIAITIAVWALLVWDHFHGGVPTHHILHNENLPGFSNWWGGITLPLLSGFLTYRIQKRIDFESNDLVQFKTIIYAFIGALSFGVLLSVFFSLGFTDLPLYLLAIVFIVAFFYPIYRAECFLGSVIGMIFTFGGVLPIIIISIFSIIGAILYLAIRPGVGFVVLLLRKN